MTGIRFGAIVIALLRLLPGGSGFTSDDTFGGGGSLGGGFTLDKVGQALYYVEQVRRNAASCKAGTGQVLDISMNYTYWRDYAMVATRVSNFLTKMWVEYEGTPAAIDDWYMYSLTRQVIESDNLIFGSMVAFGEYTYKDYQQFCAYGYKKYGKINNHDISVNYNFLANNMTEWWFGPARKEYNLRWLQVDYMPRYNSTGYHSAAVNLVEPYVAYDDGHWTKPYYDCGGGDIWMVTYSAPIFGYRPSKESPSGRKWPRGAAPSASYDFDGKRSRQDLEFVGIVSVDLQVENIDINQCDEDHAESSAMDVFFGTHKCRTSTVCKPVPGMGFQRGAYRCYCKQGYYFPDPESPTPYYDGLDVENAFQQFVLDSSRAYHSTFDCVKCSEGCDTCEDDAPCLVYRNQAARTVILILVVLDIVLALFVLIVTVRYRAVKVIKASSPVFLYLMCIGALIKCSWGILVYLEPTTLNCGARIWPQYIGFFLLYSALLLKTWRISVVFRVKSAKKLSITDSQLLKYLVPIIMAVIVYLFIWTIQGRASSIAQKVNSAGLKFAECWLDWWDYGILIARSIFLLWGVYLCYVVRSAPSSFNESKYIAWSIYNTIFLGTFIVLIRYFIAPMAGPDIIYLAACIELQVGCMVPLILIFMPKIYMIMSGRGDEVDHALDAKTGGLGNKVGPHSMMVSARAGRFTVYFDTSSSDGTIHNGTRNATHGGEVESAALENQIQMPLIKEGLIKRIRSTGSVCPNCLAQVQQIISSLKIKSNAPAPTAMSTTMGGKHEQSIAVA